MFKRPLVNYQIRADKVRVIDEKGEQIGIFSLEEALQLARERNLDLIQVTDKVEPPVCKIMEYGKYLYWFQKKEKTQRAKKDGKVKILRLSFNISPNDLENRVNQVEKFFSKGEKVKIEMILRGREKTHTDFAKEKINQFLDILTKKVPIKIEGELKKEPNGFTIIITKK